MSPSDEFVVGDSISDLILLKKKDLRTILEGVIKEAQTLDLDKLERDVEEEGNLVAREKVQDFCWTLTSSLLPQKEDGQGPPTWF